MWHFRFIGTTAAVLALLGFMEGRMALADIPTSLDSPMSLSQKSREMAGTFQVAVMGNSAIPVDVPPGPFSKNEEPKKPAADKPKSAPKASAPEKGNVKKSNATPAPVDPPVEEDGFLTKTFKKLIGDSGTDKKAVSKPERQKMAEKKSEPEKKEEGLLTKTLKSLVGGDEKEEEKKAKNNALNPLKTTPTGNATQQKKEDAQPKTAKSETKKTLKDSFEKLIGVGAVDDKAEDSKPAGTDPSPEATQSAEKKESGGLLEKILGDGDKKEPPQQAKAEVKPAEKTPEPAKPRKFTARKYPGDEEKQLEKDRGGVQKGKNVLKESFKTLVAE